MDLVCVPFLFLPKFWTPGKKSGHTDGDGKPLLLMKLPAESTAWSQVTVDFPAWVQSWMEQARYWVT